MEFQYLEAATDTSGSEGSDGEAESPRGGGGGESGDGASASAASAGSAGSGAAGALRSWRGWGGGALAALSNLQLESVQRLASEALATVRRDVGEFSEALTADAAELAAASAGAVDEALPELRATAAGLQEKLEVVGGGIETAGAVLLANIAQVRDAIIAENDANVRGRRGRGGREGGVARPAAPPSLDKLVAAMQRDSATYCDEPADTAAFAAFKAGFSLEEASKSVSQAKALTAPAQQGRAPEVAEVLRKNAFMAELHSRIVPLALTEAHGPPSATATPRASTAGEESGPDAAAAAAAAVPPPPPPPPDAGAAPPEEVAAAAWSDVAAAPQPPPAAAAPPSPPPSPPPPDAPPDAPPAATPRSGSDSVGSEGDMRSDVSGSWSVVSADAGAVAATPPPTGAMPPAPDAGPTPSPSPLPPSLARAAAAVEEEEEELDEDWGMS